MKFAQNLTALLLVAALPFQMTAQKWFTRDAKVQFDATASNSPEDIKASTNSGTFVFDQSSSNLQAAVLIKGFQFEKALMQEHFNENYMESAKYPKATFKGKIDDPSKVKFDKDGTYTATVSGDLTMHGVTKAVSVPATFTVKQDKIGVSATFATVMKDYNIDVPSLVADKLAKEAKIKIEGNLTKLN